MSDSETMSLIKWFLLLTIHGSKCYRKAWDTLMSWDTHVFPYFKEDSIALLKEHGLEGSGPESRLHKLPGIWPQQSHSVVGNMEHDDCISFVNRAFVQGLLILVRV